MLPAQTLVAHATPTTEAAPAPAPLGGMLWPQLVAELQTRIDALPFARVQPHYVAFLGRHDFADTPQLRLEFNRVWTLFELTRDGGPWKLRWAITNQEPSSAKIWQAWASQQRFDGVTSATAECDELSALFAWLASSIGIKKVGLVWPTSNHTIAAWEPTAARPSNSHAPPRVLVPTSQIFQACGASLDETSFDNAHGRLGQYPGRDLPKSALVPAHVVSFLLRATEDYAGASPALLALLRMHRNTRQNSSTEPCTSERKAWSLLVRDTPANARALATYAAEMQWPVMPRAALLAKLAE